MIKTRDKMWSYEKFLLLLLWIDSQCIETGLGSMDNLSTLDVDKFIDNYVSEVKRTLRLDFKEHKIHKRNHLDVDLFQLQGVDLLVGFQEEFSLPASFPNDLVLFSLCPFGQLNEELWYAASLEANGDKPHISLANNLVLYKYQNGQWLRKHNVTVMDGMRLATEQIGDTVHIIVAEYHAHTGRGSPVFHVNYNTDKLEPYPMLNTYFASHVIMWKWEDIHTFAAVAISENPPGLNVRYSTHSPVYQWQGSYFDMIDTLPTYNPKALAQFTIQSSMFIAVANFQNENGETAVDSDIFRYNLATAKFRLYQKLPTEAAVDVKYFCFKGPQSTESFLIYASAYNKDGEGTIHHNAVSVIYKFSVEEYFVPFQALREFRVTSWLPVRHVKNNRETLTLIGTTDEGIVSYQYDGWRFVLTGVQYDMCTFGPGAKSINVFHHNEQTFISAANKESVGYQFNVFSPVFRHYSDLENMQQEIIQWEQEMYQEIAEVEAKITILLQIAQSTPSINDKVIELGKEVIFHYAEIDNVETFSTNVNKDNIDGEVSRNLFSLSNQLDYYQKQLQALQSKLLQTTSHTYTVYEDVEESFAEITCTPTCIADDLRVYEMNGENVPEFLENIVDINEPVEFDEEITFEKLALNDPLATKMINGHPVENVVDWSKEVILNHGLKVEGDVILQNDLSVSGSLDGVKVSVDTVVRGEATQYSQAGVTLSPTKFLEVLNTSQLYLSDGQLSQIDFERFNEFTLKTEGDQFITEFQEFERIEADVVVAGGCFFRTGPIQSSPLLRQQSPCEGESCSEHEELSPSLQSVSSMKAAEAESDIESINLLDDEIIIPHDVVIYGTVIIQDGSLTAEDLIDSKHQVSAKNLMKFGIPLSESVINNHFVFNAAFEASKLTVDTLNGVNLSSLVDPDDPNPIVVTGKKEFREDLTVEVPSLVTGTVNGINLTAMGRLAEVQLDNLTVKSINSSDIEIGGKNLQHLLTRRVDSTLFLKNLHVEEDLIVSNVTVQGQINNIHLKDLLLDTVYKDGNVYTVRGRKHFVNGLKISDLTLNTPNALTPQSVWKKYLSGKKVIKVDKLFYTGHFDGIPSNEFGKWLLTDSDQTVWGSQTMDSLQAENVMVPANGTFNSLNIHTLITEAVFLNDNATFENIIFEGSVNSSHLTIEGKLNKLQVPDDLLLSSTNSSQHVTAHKHFQGSLTVNGSLLLTSLLSSVNVTAFCRAQTDKDTKLIISGNATFMEEPNISISVNNKKWTDLREQIWFKEDNINTTKPVLIYSAQLNNLAVEYINNNDVEKSLSKLVSLSQDQIVEGTFYFSKVSMQNGLEAREATVGGKVQGLHLESFLKTVMLDGIDQEIVGVPDFRYLIVDDVLPVEGFVNGLNLSQDVMLTNVPSNFVNSTLVIYNLTVEDLRLPHGTLVNGVDLEKWNKTAVKKSADNIIEGNLVFTGQFDSANGIRVEGFVNGLRFDEENLLLMNRSQTVTGVKTFSSHAKLNISNLRVRGYVNGINITDFYNQQITNMTNITLSGHKKFTSPLHTETVILPEIYQGYNLTWLETQMTFNLPWAQYYSQLVNLADKIQLADKSLAGQAYYLKNITKVRDIEGLVLFTFPLKTDTSSVLATIRLDNNRTVLSLLQWNAKYNMFLDMPGSVRYFLKVAPVGVQTVTLPRGELIAYVTSYLPLNSSQSVSYGEIFRLKDNAISHTKIYGGQSGSQLLTFQDHKARTCYIVVMNMCSVYCPTETGRRIRLPSFSCQNITEATMFTMDHNVFLLGLQSGPKKALIVWELYGKKFTQVMYMPQFNSVSIAASTTRFPHIAVATRHRVGSSHPESIDIYRFNTETYELLLEQTLLTISPRKVLFASVPSNESVMYVVSDNPASPLEMFVYRGILGYQHFMVETTLPTPLDMYAYTDYLQRHFVVAHSEKKGYVLQAQFEGKPSSL